MRRMTFIGAAAFAAAMFGGFAPASAVDDGLYMKNLGDNALIGNDNRTNTTLAADVGAPMLGDILNLDLGAGDNIARTSSYDVAGANSLDHSGSEGGPAISDKVGSSMMYIVLPIDDVDARPIKA